jgi:mono/diheme cytochrome c family protein
VTPKLLALGRKRYDITCATCHGPAGDGVSIVGTQMALRPPPSLVTQKYIEKPSGYIFEIATKGFGLMASYAAELSVEERWAVVAYIRALQLSQTGLGQRRPAGRARQARRPARGARRAPQRGAPVSAPSSSPLQMERFQGGGRLLMAGGALGLVLTAVSLFGGPRHGSRPRVGLVPRGLRLLVRHRHGVGHHVADLPRDAREVDDRPQAARRGDGLDGAALHPALHPHRVHGIEAALLVGRAGREPLERDAEAARHKKVMAQPDRSSRTRLLLPRLRIVVHGLLYGWSKKQDTTGDVQLTQKQRKPRRGAGSPFVGPRIHRSRPSTGS